MEFCYRCGRYLKEHEYQCPECGNIVRQPTADELPPEILSMYNARAEPVDLKKVLFDKYFFLLLALSSLITFSVTYYWRFTFLFFFIPLFLPSRRPSIALGLLMGVCLGSCLGLLVKYMAPGIIG